MSILADMLVHARELGFIDKITEFSLFKGVKYQLFCFNAFPN